MKKLTAGIFATLLAVVSVDGAYAAIASQGYVDEQVGEVESTVSTINTAVTELGDTINNAETGLNKQVEDLGTRVTTAEGEIDTLQTDMAAKADAADLDTKVDANAAITAGTGTKITYDAKGLVTGSSNLTAADIPALTTDKITGLDTELGSKASQADLTALTGRVTTAEGDIGALQAPKAQVAEGVTGPVSGGTVYTAIENVTGNVGTVTGRVDTLEGEMDQAQSDITKLQTGKQDKLTGPVGSATQPVYVNAEGNVVAGTAYGSLATKSTVTSADITDGTIAEGDLNESINASLDKADTALQEAALADYVTTDAANAAYAVKALEGQVGTVSKENMGTTNATTVVGGVKEAIDAAKAADTKAGEAATAASTAQSAAEAAQGEVDALEVVVNNETTGLAAAHTAIDALESGKLDKTGTAARATADASGKVITDTYATKAEIADMATDANLKLKQDKTDNNLATTDKTVVGAINEVKGTADAAIPKPDGECSVPANKCVLTWNNSAYAWEVIARGDAE